MGTILPSPCSACDLLRRLQLEEHVVLAVGIVDRLDGLDELPGLKILDISCNGGLIETSPLAQILDPDACMS